MQVGITSSAVKSVASSFCATLFLFIPFVVNAATIYTSTIDNTGIIDCTTGANNCATYTFTYNGITSVGKDLRLLNYYDSTVSGTGQAFIYDGTGVGGTIECGAQLTPENIGSPLAESIADFSTNYGTYACNLIYGHVYTFTSYAGVTWSVHPQHVASDISASVPYFEISDSSGFTGSLINFNSYYQPTLFASSSYGIATNSALWGSVSLASSSVRCDGGNYLSDAICSVGAYLFVPNPNTINGLVQTMNGSVTHFPFSWIYGIQQAISTLNATSTTMSSFSINWSGMNVGTSSPLGLANIAPASTTVFSQNTIQKYISTDTWNIFQTLIAASIWLAFAADVFFTARNQMHRV